MKRMVAFSLLALAGMWGATAAQAQTYKIGMSAGLTGYAATVDRAWRDGVQVAVDYLNARGGINGRKIELIVEDNRSEPQEAVTVYRKMISNDKVDIFLSGCVSAGNFAAARCPFSRKAATASSISPANVNVRRSSFRPTCLDGVPRTPASIQRTT